MSVFATILIAVAGSSVLTAVVTGAATFSVNRATAEKMRTERDSLIAEAAKKWQGIADEAATKALTIVQAQCTACEKRLAISEERLHTAEARQELAEKRQSAAEDRVRDLEERERQTRAVVRTVVRASDSNDPTAMETAIAAARELV